MSCGQASRIDVEDFLVDAAASEFESFRAHYPGCPECAAAVASWSAFDLALRDVVGGEGSGPGTHPEPERLEAFLRSAASMGEEAMRIEKHVAVCASCQTEMSVLRRFDPDLLGAGARAGSKPPAGVAEPSRGSLVEGLRRFVDSLSGGLDFGSRAAVPAFAVAFVLVLGVWWGGFFGGVGRPDVDQPTGTPGLAQQESPATSLPDPSGSRPPATAPGIGARDSQLAEDRIRPEARLASESEAERPVEPAEEKAPDSSAPGPEQLAQAAPRQPATSTPESQGRPATREEPAPSATAGESPREEILLAALTELPLPSYAAPEGAESLGWMRQFGAVRSGATGAEVETRAPANHAGLTLSSSPRLWWRVSADTDDAIQVTIVDEEAIDPVLRVDLPGPHEAGLHSIDLSRQGITLDAGVEFRWFVSLVVDPDRPSRNPVSAGALRVVPETDSRRKAAAEALPAERGHTLARLGIWYDAYDFFASLAEAHPNLVPIVNHRERMMDLARVQN